MAVSLKGGLSLHLPQSLEPLDADAIRRALDPERRRRLRHLEVLFETESTNTRLLGLAAPPTSQADVAIAELQTAGRGRRGRSWHAPLGACVTLSLGWSFADAARVDPALSLAVGVAVARALSRAGASGVRLKWPNDLWLDDRKLGGVLLELRGEAGGPAHVVIGIGVNVRLSAAERRGIEGDGSSIAALEEACAAPPSRNFVAGAIIDELLSMLPDYAAAGFAPFRAAWTALDALDGRPARVIVGSGTVPGIARGVDPHGALILERDGMMQKFVSGDVSLRLAEGSR